MGKCTAHKHPRRHVCCFTSTYRTLHPFPSPLPNGCGLFVWMELYLLLPCTTNSLARFHRVRRADPANMLWLLTVLFYPGF